MSERNAQGVARRFVGDDSLSSAPSIRSPPPADGDDESLLVSLNCWPFRKPADKYSSVSRIGTSVRTSGSTRKAPAFSNSTPRKHDAKPLSKRRPLASVGNSNTSFGPENEPYAMLETIAPKALRKTPVLSLTSSGPVSFGGTSGPVSLLAKCPSRSSGEMRKKARKSRAQPGMENSQMIVAKAADNENKTPTNNAVRSIAEELVNLPPSKPRDSPTPRLKNYWKGQRADEFSGDFIIPSMQLFEDIERHDAAGTKEPPTQAVVSPTVASKALEIDLNSLNKPSALKPPRISGAKRPAQETEPRPILDPELTRKIALPKPKTSKHVVKKRKREKTVQNKSSRIKRIISTSRLIVRGHTWAFAIPMSGFAPTHQLLSRVDQKRPTCNFRTAPPQNTQLLTPYDTKPTGEKTENLFKRLRELLRPENERRKTPCSKAVALFGQKMATNMVKIHDVVQRTHDAYGTGWNDGNFREFTLMIPGDLLLLCLSRHNLRFEDNDKILALLAQDLRVFSRVADLIVRLGLSHHYKKLSKALRKLPIHRTSTRKVENEDEIVDRSDPSIDEKWIQLMTRSPPKTYVKSPKLLSGCVLSFYKSAIFIARAFTFALHLNEVDSIDESLMQKIHGCLDIMTDHLHPDSYRSDTYLVSEPTSVPESAKQAHGEYEQSNNISDSDGFELEPAKPIEPRHEFERETDILSACILSPAGIKPATMQRNQRKKCHNKGSQLEAFDYDSITSSDHEDCSLFERLSWLNGVFGLGGLSLLKPKYRTGKQQSKPADDSNADGSEENDDDNKKLQKTAKAITPEHDVPSEISFPSPQQAKNTVSLPQADEIIYLHIDSANQEQGSHLSSDDSDVVASFVDSNQAIKTDARKSGDVPAVCRTPSSVGCTPVAIKSRASVFASDSAQEPVPREELCQTPELKPETDLGAISKEEPGLKCIVPEPRIHGQLKQDSPCFLTLLERECAWLFAESYFCFKKHDKGFMYHFASPSLKSRMRLTDDKPSFEFLVRSDRQVRAQYFRYHARVAHQMVNYGDYRPHTSNFIHELIS